MTGGRRPPRLPTDEEHALWLAHTQGDVRLLASKRAEMPEPPARPPVRKAGEANAPVHLLPVRENLAPLAPGDLSGLDGRQAQRFRQGKLVPEATLDLHGHTLASARDALERFLTRVWMEDKRVVLVVTGRGKRGAEEGDRHEVGEGTLRAQVPQWLNQSPLRGLLVAFDHARQQHGGFGALCLYLRKRP